MNPRFEAAWEIHQFLVEQGIPYAIIGGTALPRWGEPRFTEDVDLVVVTSLEKGVAPFVNLVLKHFASRELDALTFARQNRVIKITASNHCDVDISLGVPGYEEQVLKRAVEYDLGKGKMVRVCSAEDLVVLKCVAGRPQDLIDIEGVLIRQRAHLDLPYVRKWLQFFDQYLPEPHAVKDFKRALASLSRKSTKTKTRKK